MAEQDAEPPLRIHLFGPFLALRKDTPLRGLHLREGERLLAYLVLRGGEPISAREVARLFWPSEARMMPLGQEDFPSVRQALYSLRQALGTEAFRLNRPHRGTIAFDLTGVSVDIHDFDRLSQQEGVGVTDAWEAATFLYRGPLLEGWNDTWAVEARQRRRRVYEYTLRRLAEYFLSQNEATTAERWIRRLLLSRPDDEDMGRELIRLLVVGNRSAEAKEALVKLTEAVQASGRALATETQELVIPSPMRAEPTPAVAPELEIQPEFAQLALAPVGGAVALDSQFYVVRETDAQFYAALSQRDSLVLVKGVRQAGKTSLLARGLQRAREAGLRVIATDFQHFNAAQFASLDSLYLALATTIALQLELDVVPQQVWEPDYGANTNLEMFLKRQVLRVFPEPLVWGMDEVDRLFSYPFGGEAFGLFRSWHNARALHPSGPWSRLTLAIAYATEAHLFIEDLNQSPFNVGTRLALDDFTGAEVARLNQTYGNPLRAEELRRLQDLVGGHPYLVQRSLNEIARGMPFAVLEAEGERDGGLFDNHLRRLFAVLGRAPELVEAVRHLLTGSALPSADTFYRLRSAGILAGASSRDARFRCRLYASALKRRFL